MRCADNQSAWQQGVIDMELRQLRAVLAIAQTGSVTKAAELLHVVQPAISRQLRQIEQDLGKPLFQRVHNGMEPTPEGLLLIDHARRALLSLDQAVAEIKPSRGEVAGLVSYLMSDIAGYVTRQVISINGGMV